jgi:hypothetical protein
MAFFAVGMFLAGYGWARVEAAAGRERDKGK